MTTMFLRTTAATLVLAAALAGPAGAQTDAPVDEAPEAPAANAPAGTPADFDPLAYFDKLFDMGLIGNVDSRTLGYRCDDGTTLDIRYERDGGFAFAYIVAADGEVKQLPAVIGLPRKIFFNGGLALELIGGREIELREGGQDGTKVRCALPDAAGG